MGLEELRRAAEADPTLDNLRALRGGIEAELRALDEAAGGNDLDAEQAERWSALDAEHRATVERIQAEERAERVRESRRRWQSTQVGSRVEPFDGRDVRSLPPGEARSRALALIDRDEVARSMPDHVRERAEQVVRTANGDTNGAIVAQRLLLTENPHYRSAFMKLTSTPNPILTTEEARAVEVFQEWRSMSVGTGSEGGYGVPVLIDPTIILTGQGSSNPFFRLARVETITTNEWKGVTSAGATWQFRAEAASATDNSPTLDQPTVPTHRADGYIPYSIEVGMDYPGFAGEMQRLLAEGYSELLVSAFTTGTGVNEPTGIITALAGTGSEVDVATTGAIDADDINGLWAALPIRYRNPAGQATQAWMGATSVNNAVQRLGAGNDLSAFTVDFTAEGVMVLKGRRWELNDYCGELNGAATGLVIVGDWRNYLIAQRAGMSIELIPHVVDTSGAKSVPTGERAWFAWARVGADSINDDGFRMLSDDGA